MEKNGREITNITKNYDLLLALVVNEGRVLLNDELLEIVRPETFVEKSNLKKGISAIRQVLGETPESSQRLQLYGARSFVQRTRNFIRHTQLGNRGH